MKIIYSTYVKANIEQVADTANHLNIEERNQLLSLLKKVEDLYDITLRYWVKDPLDLELNPYSKLSNWKYCPFRIINKKTFRKELQHLVKIGVLTLVQYS